MKRRDIYILLGSLVGVGILIAVLVSLRKKNNNVVQPIVPIGGSGAGPTIDLNIQTGDNGFELDAGFGARTMKEGLNVFSEDLYSAGSFMPNTATKGFNMYDATSPLATPVSLEQRREAVMVVPPNQWGGVIKNF